MKKLTMAIMVMALTGASSGILVAVTSAPSAPAPMHKPAASADKHAKKPGAHMGGKRAKAGKAKGMFHRGNKAKAAPKSKAPVAPRS